MTPKQEAAMRQALEALNKLVVGSEYEEAVEAEQAMDALSAALAEPGHKPVHKPFAYLWVDLETQRYVVDRCDHPLSELIPVYAAPPQRKPLTLPQIHELNWPDDVAFEDILEFTRAIEAAHGIKENT